jgi:hypothetical protein
MEGPFEILEERGHSFLLKLPETMKVHPVFHAEKLRKDPGNPLPGQANPEPPPVVLEDGEQEYDVERILAVKLVRKRLKYKIQWVGWDEDPDWYPASTLSNSPLALQRFYEKHSDNTDLPGPPRNLQYWLDCARDDIRPQPRKDDDIPSQVT